MGEMELRKKYGGKIAKAINRAIRAEIPNGNAALDKLTQLAGPALHSGWYDHQGNPTAEGAAYFKHKHDVVDKMEATIREKWKIASVKPKPRRRRSRG
jgi:hypothetical protein